MTTALAIFSGTPPPPALNDLVAKIAPRSVFLIYAERGVGGEELGRTYYRAAADPKQLWKVPGAGHIGGFGAQPMQYEQRVAGFFNRALLAAASPS